MWMWVSTMKPKRDNYWYLVSRVQGPVKYLKIHRAALQQRTKCQLCQGWDSLVHTCSGWVTFQQNCSLGKCKTTICKEKPSLIILSLPVSISFGYFFKVYPKHYFLSAKFIAPSLCSIPNHYLQCFEIPKKYCWCFIFCTLMCAEVD